MMLDGLLRQKLIDVLLDLKKLKGRLDYTVEQEGEIDQHRKADYLQPLECLPT